MVRMDYQIIDRALQRIDSDYGAADCHGVICGVLAVDDALSTSLWIDEVIIATNESDVLYAESRLLLNELFADTREQLYGMEFGFTPLLPDDGVMLRERVTALRQWCQGFVYGLALAGVNRDTRLPGDVAEIVKDLIEIAKVEVVDVTDDQEEEAYAELVEYIKVGVLLACEELRLPKAPPHMQ